MYLKRNGGTPITLEWIAKKGRKMNGRTIWVDGPDGREPHQYDVQTSSLLTVQQFTELQKKRRAAKQSAPRHYNSMACCRTEVVQTSDTGLVPGPVPAPGSSPNIVRSGHGAAGYFVRQAGL